MCANYTLTINARRFDLYTKFNVRTMRYGGVSTPYIFIFCPNACIHLRFPFSIHGNKKKKTLMTPSNIQLNITEAVHSNGAEWTTAIGWVFICVTRKGRVLRISTPNGSHCCFGWWKTACVICLFGFFPFLNLFYFEITRNLRSHRRDHGFD